MSRRRGPWAGLVLIGLLIGLAFSNPPLERHRQRIGEVLAEAAAEEGVLGKIAAGAGAGELVANMLPLEYQNYILFSVASLDDEQLSFGVFGQVFVNTSKD